jgi:hypothetical protein
LYGELFNIDTYSIVCSFCYVDIVILPHSATSILHLQF